MLSAVEYSHLLLRGRLLPGDMAVDATAGNGHDTIFLARLTGPQGKVFAFDATTFGSLLTFYIIGVLWTCTSIQFQNISKQNTTIS